VQVWQTQKQNTPLGLPINSVHHSNTAFSKSKLFIFSMTRIFVPVALNSLMGGLPNVKSIIFHLTWFEHDFGFTIPPAFASMGGEDGWDLYIMFSEESMGEYDDLDSARLVVSIVQPPKSCKSATLIVGEPTVLGALPLLGFFIDGEKRPVMPLSVVLLPWDRDGQYEKYTEYDTKALHSWIAEEDPDFDRDQRRRFIGMESDGLWGIQAGILGCRSQSKAEAEKSNYPFESKPFESKRS
jgi:hypothetical protein